MLQEDKNYNQGILQLQHLLFLKVADALHWINALYSSGILQHLFIYCHQRQPPSNLLNQIM